MSNVGPTRYSRIRLSIFKDDVTTVDAFKNVSGRISAISVRIHADDDDDGSKKDSPSPLVVIRSQASSS